MGKGIEIRVAEPESVFDDSWTLEAWADGFPVGRMVVSARQYTYGRTSEIPYAEIRELYVTEGYQRRRIGSFLLQYALHWAAENGFARLAVEASAQPGTPGAPFYEAHGFTARSIIYDIPLHEEARP
jgi:GNAT superfamily N-acetyltransferase